MSDREGLSVCPSGAKLAAALLLVAALGSAGLRQTAVASAAAGAPPGQLVTTDPSLFPAFDPSVTDYVARCVPGSPVRITVSAPDGTAVGVAGRPPQSGTFATAVTRTAGQSFSFTVQQGAAPPSTYYVRCLPPDFPTWTATRAGSPQSEWYTTLLRPLQGAGGYVAIFDDNGVPVWWTPAPGGFFATVLPNGDVGWTSGSGAVEDRLDGTVATSIAPVAATPDFHELLLLDDGNYVMIGTRLVAGADFSSWGGPSSAPLLDQIIQEITPAGQVVWEWDTASHIPVSETDPQWRAQLLASGGNIDAYHMNSVESDGDGMVVSFRQLDAVYRIDKATGAVTWKLGGSARPESLTVMGDAVFTQGGGFGGQHDARVLPGPSVSLHDNGTGRGRAPRALRYTIDTTARTATMAESVADPAAGRSLCCGGSRKLPGGDWAVSWGATPLTEELDPLGKVVMRFQWQTGWFSYRVVPVVPGVLSRASLRSGMESQYPAGYWLTAGDGGVFAFGAAHYFGSAHDASPDAPIVGVAASPDRRGYWQVGADGGVFAFGDAPFLGSTGGLRLNQPVVGMAATPDGQGYWLVASDGGVFAFGDARFLGSTGALPLNRPVVGMAATPDGQGYWLVASDGGVFAFGDAQFLGSTAQVPLNSPIVGMAALADGSGYWLASADGGVFSFGAAGYDGSVVSTALNRPVIGISSPDGGGYVLVAADGGVFSFGDAHTLGSLAGVDLDQPVTAVAM